VFEQDSGTQTDALEDLPVPPVFMPKPVGDDMGTSIEPGELFDFDLAVEPCLEVLVGKALEQALMEVLEEEEISRLKSQRTKFEQERNQIMTEAQRMEAQSLRHHQEKERRLQQERERVANEKEVARKAAARTAAKNFLSGLQANVVSSLSNSGHLYDPIHREVDAVFMPWLLQSVASRLQQVNLARGQVDSLISGAVEALKQQVEDKRRADAEAEAAKQAAEAERIRLAEEIKRLAAEAEAERAAKEAADAAEAQRKEEQGSEEAAEANPADEDDGGEEADDPADEEED
jgi:hypothetical protein